MNRILSYIPTWETFLLYIGGIPTIISATLFTIVVFFTTKSKAFSLIDCKDLFRTNKELNAKEDKIRERIIAAPGGTKFLMRVYLGDTNYTDLVNGG